MSARSKIGFAFHTFSVQLHLEYFKIDEDYFSDEMKIELTLKVARIERTSPYLRFQKALKTKKNFRPARL